MSEMKSPLPVVADNSRIAISFELALPDGQVVEQATEREPLEFVIGDGTLLPKLDELLVGLELGTKAKFTLPPESAFGKSDPENIQTMLCSDFPANLELSEGQVIGFQTPTGDEVPGTILSVNDQQVEIDFNHPLADATILFTAKIEKILE